MAAPLPWPGILVPSAEDWSLRGGTRSGGQSFEGNELLVASPTARWKAALTIPAFGRDRICALRRVVALGRSQVWSVGPYERPRAPWPIEPVVGGAVTDRTPGLAQPPLAFSLMLDAAANAAAIAIRRDRGGLLAPGMIFSIGGRLHVIVGLTTADPADPASGLAIPGGVGVAIRPWLRTDLPAGTPIAFGAPVGTMRFASDDTGALDLQLSRYGTVTLDLVEAF